MSTDDASPDSPLDGLVSEIAEHEAKLAVNSAPGTSPPGESRGRLRIVRRGRRSSSAGSGCSSVSGDMDAAVVNKVANLVQLYHQTGEYSELAKTARDEGIPASMRRVC